MTAVMLQSDRFSGWNIETDVWQTELHCSFPCNIAKYRKRLVAKNVAQLDESLSDV